MSKAASKLTMEKLHEATARSITNQLVDASGNLRGECEACGRGSIDPRVLSAAIKFLHDNGIEAINLPTVNTAANLPTFDDDGLPDE